MPVERSKLTQERLRDLLHYDPDTGVFTRTKKVLRCSVGDVAGSTSGDGRLYIGIDGVRHHAHRLAWLYVYGEMPERGIEHINTVRHDNRISNLRLVPDGYGELTQSRLHELFAYNAETGELTRKKSRRGADSKDAGWINKIGYHCVCVDRQHVLVHRLIWMYVHGHWPSICIDHINGNRSDNRLCNLRESNNAQNRWNVGSRKDSSSGIKGIFPTRRGKWAAQICQNGKTFHLGTFTTKDDASAAYQKAALNLHGEFAKF